MKSALIALLAMGVAGAAYAQNAQMPAGPSNPPPGTSYSGTQNPHLPPSSTGTAKPNALNPNASSGEAAARYKFEQAGFHDVKGLSRTPDGVWSGRAVKNGVEVAVSMDAAGNIAIQ
jgi:hypothetical protein